MEKDNLAESFLKCQMEFPAITLDAEVEVTTKKGYKYKFKYASYANILKTCLPVLHKHGIAYSQVFGYIDGAEGVPHMITKLIKGDEIMTSPIPIGMCKDMQEFGSQITYLKRYCASAILGICAEADDDGNIEAGNDWKPTKQKPPKKATEPLKPTPVPDKNPDNAKEVGLKIKKLKNRIIELDSEKTFNEIMKIHSTTNKNYMDKTEKEIEELFVELEHYIDKMEKKEAA